MNSVFRIVQIMTNKVTFVGFRGRDRPQSPPLDLPLTAWQQNSEPGFSAVRVSNRQINCHCKKKYQLIGIELLTSATSRNFGSYSWFPWRGKCPFQPTYGRPLFWRTTSSKLFTWVQCKSAPILVILFAFPCSATMLTSKVVTEIIENHSECYVCANSCNKFVSSRSW